MSRYSEKIRELDKKAAILGIQLKEAKRKYQEINRKLEAIIAIREKGFLKEEE